MAKTNKNANYVTEKKQVAVQTKAKAKSSLKTKEITKQVLLISAVVLAVAAILTGFIFGLIGCTRSSGRRFIAPVDGAFDVTDVVEIEFEGYGTVQIELYGKEAPETVKNFLELVNSGKLEDSTVSFAAKDSKDQKMTVSVNHDHDEEGHKDYIKGEFYDNGVKNRISHIEGVLTMSRYGSSSSSKNSFMIMLNNHTGETDTTDSSGNTTIGYDGNYAAFGKVANLDSLNVIKKMQEDKNETASSSSSSATKKENELVFDSNSIKVTESDITKGTIEYTFTPEVSGKYTFKSAGFKSFLLSIATSGTEEENPNSKSVLDKQMTEDELKAGIEYDLEKGVEYKVILGTEGLKKDTTKVIYVLADILFEGKNEIEITKADIPTKAEQNESQEGTESDGTAAQADDTIEPNFLEYYFTPNYSGVYYFKTEDDIADKLEIFDGVTSLGKIGKEEYIALEKDKKYTVIVTVESTAKEDSYEIQIAAPVIATGDNKLEIPEFVLKEGNASYYFTPTADGKYTFINKDITFAVYNANGEKLEGEYLDLKKDEIYKVEITVDLSNKVYIGTNNITLVGEEGKGNDAVKKEYTFTAEATGDYTFIASANLAFEIYSGSTKQEAENGVYKLFTGKKYTVKVDAIPGDYTLSISVDSASEEEINILKYTVTIQDKVLAVGTNKQTITKVEIDAKSSEFTFTATTNGPVSFKGIYQVLDENGEPVKATGGGNKYKYSTIKLLDKDGNELDSEYAVLVKDEVYTVVLDFKNAVIQKDQVCTITISKIAPKIASAKVA